MIHLHGTQAVAFRVLVVDKEPIQRVILARCVEMLGWKADTAISQSEAINKFSPRPHDIVVLDLGLGLSETIELLRRLKRTRADPSVIFVSGKGDRCQADVFNAACEFNFRVAGALARPVDPYKLHALLLSNPVRPYQPGSNPLAPDTSGPDGLYPDGLHMHAAYRPAPNHPGGTVLEQALRNNELHTEYQPKTDLLTGEVVGVEALARWHSPSMGTIGPEKFIPVAEQSGLIGQLTARVLEDAIAACRRWREVRPDCSVSVNISPSVLADPGFIPMLAAILRENRMPPEALIAEIPESALLSNLPVAIEALTMLSLKGVRVSMDGFGSGFISLASLQRMPFAELKIDRSFIGISRVDPDAWKLIRATVALARDLGMDVVAEGVETKDMGDRSRDAGCDMGQGWYFGRPMQADAMLRCLAAPRLARQMARPDPLAPGRVQIARVRTAG